MTDLRKAAKEAAKVLANALSIDFNDKRDWYSYKHDVEYAANLLCQALARPEQVSIEPPDYVEPITFDYHEGWEEGFKAGVESAKNKKESTPSNVDPLLHGGDGNYIKQAQPEQNAVAWMWKDGTITTDPDYADGTWTPLYTTPPPKQWVGLTDEERRHYNNRLSGSGVAEEIEAKLKEKNT